MKKIFLQRPNDPTAQRCSTVFTSVYFVCISVIHRVFWYESSDNVYMHHLRTRAEPSDGGLWSVCNGAHSEKNLMKKIFTATCSSNAACSWSFDLETGSNLFSLCTKRSIFKHLGPLLHELKVLSLFESGAAGGSPAHRGVERTRPAVLDLSVCPPWGGGRGDGDGTANADC